jgi:DNA-binding response OmpR family regulator
MTAQTILLVEDDRDIADVFTELLASEGHDVSTVYDGRRAFEFLQTHSVDLLISDIRLPGMNGIDLAASIRDGGSVIPVILISAMEPGNRIRAIPNVVFLKKPVSLDTLLDAVAVALPDGAAE